jgi:hypothetical protein
MKLSMKEAKKEEPKVRKTLSLRKSTNTRLIMLYAELGRQQSEIVDISVAFYDFMRGIIPEEYLNDLSEALLNGETELAKTILREALIHAKI